jgi:NAD(P)H dehydrogenase (quinone)
MPTNILIAFYSSYGHVHQLAKAVEEGAKSVPDTEVRLRRVAELDVAKAGMSKQEGYVKAQEQMKDIPVATNDDLVWADGICWGTPTRYGNMAAQMKQFIDGTGGLWQKGSLEHIVAGVFTSTATIHGGQESTILTMHVPLLHLGMILVGSNYGENPQILVTDAVGGSPYGPSTIAGGDGSKQPSGSDLTTSKNLGIRVAKVASRTKDLRKRS